MLIQTAVPATYPRGILRRRGAPRARALAFWSFVFSLILMIPNSVNAQVDTGAIQGTLTDNSGGRVPGATVVLQNEGTAFALTATTGQDGAYVFNPIHIGTYSVTVTAPGFQKESLAHLEVAVQQHRVADFALQPGAVTTTITVTSAAAALQTRTPPSVRWSRLMRSMRFRCTAEIISCSPSFLPEPLRSNRTVGAWH